MDWAIQLVKKIFHHRLLKINSLGFILNINPSHLHHFGVLIWSSFYLRITVYRTVWFHWLFRIQICCEFRVFDLDFWYIVVLIFLLPIMGIAFDFVLNVIIFFCFFSFFILCFPKCKTVSIVSNRLSQNFSTEKNWNLLLSTFHLKPGLQFAFIFWLKKFFYFFFCQTNRLHRHYFRHFKYRKFLIENILV